MYVKSTYSAYTKVEYILYHGWEVNTGFIQPKVEGWEVLAWGLSHWDLRPRIGNPVSTDQAMT